MRGSNRLLPILFFADDADKGGTGGGSGGSAPADVEATVRRIIEEGRTEQKLVDLHVDNHNLRAKLKDTERVPEGGRVLSAEEAQAFDAYRELGEAEEVKSTLERATELEAKDARRTRAEKIREAAKAAGYTDGAETALMELRSLDEADIEVREERDGEETVTVPYVTLAGEGQVPQKLDAFLENDHPVIRRGLLAEEKNEGEASKRGAGQPYLKQQSGEERSKGKASSEDFRRATEETASYTL